jgi:mannose-6-phosphate isomerase-like protein (cupin superfamily)
MVLSTSLDGRQSDMRYSLRKIDDMEAIYGGVYKRARAELGLKAFGMQVLDLPPNDDGHPAHDHAEDGQEEVYVVLRGSVDVEIEGERLVLDTDSMLAVGPGVMRKLRPRGRGARVLAVGGVPGRGYEPKPVTELGGPDPSAR